MNNSFSKLLSPKQRIPAVQIYKPIVNKKPIKAIKQNKVKKFGKFFHYIKKKASIIEYLAPCYLKIGYRSSPEV